MTSWAAQELLKSAILGLTHLSLHPAVLRIAITCLRLLTKTGTALLETRAHQDWVRSHQTLNSLYLKSPLY